MKSLKIMRLTQQNLKYVSEKLETNWNGDFDGSMIDMCIDKAFPKWVRIGVEEKKKEVLYFNKELFTDFLLSNPKYKDLAQKAYTEYKNSDGYDEYEYYLDHMESIIDDYHLSSCTKYISAYDFILDVLLPKKTKKVYCSCCDSAYATVVDGGQNSLYICTMCRENEPKRFQNIDNTIDIKNAIDYGND
ncbi:hypothetical protein [Sulfurimonas indica]|uniref:hypothetical protein n=1 Tax=Sulfurimonas indica TaxID=2508707 RepID=UPI001264CBEF|nr:hypothetical protein [Sulfurimonas indica]